MHPDLSLLDEFLESIGVDGYLIDAASSDSNQRYLSGFDAPDPFVTLYTPDGLHLLVSGLEFGRAKTESHADTVDRPADFDLATYRESYDEREAIARTREDFLAAYGVDSVAVPERFPIGAADGLRERGVEVRVDTDDVLLAIRSVKTDAERQFVRTAQRANESAMATAQSLISAATVHEGVLQYDGEPLTSERLKQAIEVELLRHGCGLDETIVACGSQAADPHERGSGPLTAGEPIIVDIFPRDKETKYHSDMTRTFCKGDPSETVREWFDLTETALEAALGAVRAGATGADVHAAACDVYEDAGLPTLRTDPTTEVGFIHSTGHGVGLDVHERPGLNPRGGTLSAGQVITVEPGVYDPDVGGVRIEDIVFVTEDGYENVTDYPIDLVVE
ncbi:MAG: M24 family metallopeptidase [Halobacteriota archaeon]